MKKKSQEGEKLFGKNYILLIVVSLITSFGYSMIATLISSYGVELGASLTAAGTLVGIYSLSALLIRPFGGYATDILDKRMMCVFSTVMICVAMTGYAVAPGIRTMFLVRILHGAAFGVSGTANMALLCDYVPSKRLAEGLGYYGLGQVLSQVCGPSLGLAVKNRLGYRALFGIIALMTVLAVLVLFGVDKPACKKEEGKEKKRLTLDNLIAKECIVYALVAGLFSLGNGVINSFLLLLGEEREIAGIALFFSVNAAALFGIRLVAGKIADRNSLTLIVNISLLTSAVSMAIVGKGSVLWIMLLAAVLKAVGQGSGQISLQSACIKRVDALRVGVATSTYYIGADIGQGLGPIVAGKISSLMGYGRMFYCLAAFIVVVTIGFNFYQRRQRKA